MSGAKPIPMWFVMGPLEGRPRTGTPKPTDPDAFIPRAKANEEHLFELYPYDEQFMGFEHGRAAFSAGSKALTARRGHVEDGGAEHERRRCR